MNHILPIYNIDIDNPSEFVKSVEQNNVQLMFCYDPGYDENIPTSHVWIEDSQGKTAALMIGIPNDELIEFAKTILAVLHEPKE